MSTFEELDVAPELVEALAGEGIEEPTALQRDLVPVIRRGNNVVAVAGPGSGITVAWAAPLLERVEAEGDSPRILVLTPDADRMVGLARSVGELARVTGHRVGALDGLWVLPERAHVLVATPDAAHARIAGGHLSLEALEAVVVDGATAMAAAGSLATVTKILEGVSSEVQRVVVSLPVSEAVESFVDDHLKRAVHVPPKAGQPGDSPHRGDLTVMEVTEPREEGALRAVAHLMLEARHVVAFVRSEDAAADLGDFLGQRGYTAGRPGDADFPVWLAVDALEARRALDEGESDDVVVLSVDVPGDLDILDQRHGAGREGVILALPRELPHLKAVAAEAGYTLIGKPLPEPAGRPGPLDGLFAELEGALSGLDASAYQVLLEPLFNRYGPSAVAGAAVALLRARPVKTPTETTAEMGAPPAFIRLFISVGTKDGARPGDLVGAITGEARIESEQIGRIDLRETYSLVEVERSVAKKVIDALNGTSIRGRAARVDYHREERGSRGGDRDRGSRGGDRDRGPRSGGRPDRGGRPGGGGGGRRPGGDAGGRGRRPGPGSRDRS